MAEPLGEPELAMLTERLPQWQVARDGLVREVEAPTFPAAIEWVVMIAQAAEAMDHHPDIDIRWRRLRVALSTHSAGGCVTDLDVALAMRINAIVD